MKKIIYGVILFSIFLYTNLSAQNSFSVEGYKAFLEQNRNMTYSDLLNMHQTSLFEKKANTSSSSLYLDSIVTKYELTEGEQQLLEKNGFVVTERIYNESFLSIFANIYHKDLPVFVSTDAILHAFHRSYDAILMDVELAYLNPQLLVILRNLFNNLEALAQDYSDNPDMLVPLKDVDVYISVPLKILNETHQPYFESNQEVVENFLSFIEKQNAAPIPVFSESARTVDFSQFTPRGHYTEKEELEKYFKAMIWLGKIELYLSQPQTIPKPPEKDIQRQIVATLLLSELFSKAGVETDYTNFESIIKSFVGEQDNVKITDVFDLKTELNISTASELLDNINYNSFKKVLAAKPYASQRILSQILFSDPFSPDTIVPASTFHLFGQRFIIDSYVTANVVYDKITNNGMKVRRMLPNTLDILFSLGNDAAAQLLSKELEQYHYSSNLASLRYLIDSYDEDYWTSSIYNMWLNTLRELNPDEDRSELPSFMQTAAWGQQKMNTQLGSWAELRHDNLLYAKQSYTDGFICSYPYSYVEPYPEFYAALIEYCNETKQIFSSLTFGDNLIQEYILQHLDYNRAIYDTLKGICINELNGTEFSDREKCFLSGMYVKPGMSCGASPSGWYVKLHYNTIMGSSTLLDPDYIVADFHTAPSDEFGAMVGWVKHAGTSNPNFIFVNATNSAGEPMTFVGPVYNYSEYTTTNFKRLTDEEWSDEYMWSATKPEWTNIYTADNSGNAKSTSVSLLTSIESDPGSSTIAETYLIAKNYPNPFNPSTTISFTIPQRLANQNVNLTIYDIQGRRVIELVNKELPSGNYLTRWNGKNSSGNKAASGIYFYRIIAGDQHFNGKMNLLK